MRPWSFSTLTNIGYVFVHAHTNKYWLCFCSFFMRDNFSYWWSSVGCMLCVRLCGIYSLAPDAYVMDESTTLPGMASMNSVSDENAMTIKIQTTKKCSKYKVKEVWIELIEKAINDLNVFFCFYELHRTRNLKEFCYCLQLSWACVSSSSNLRLMERRSAATRPPKIWIWPKMISLMPHPFSWWSTYS